MIEESSSCLNELIPSISIGELVWAKIEGYPWWPSIILSIEESDKNNNPLKWEVVFLGEQNSYQFITRQKIKSWSDYTLERKGKRRKENNTLLAAIAFGNGIQGKELSFTDHKIYLRYLEEETISSGELGVEEFKKIIKEGIALKKADDDVIESGTNAKIGIEEEVKAVFSEMDNIKRNMDKIMKTVPPEHLLKSFCLERFAKKNENNENDMDVEMDMDNADDKMALLNYLEFLCRMYKIPYDANESLTALLNSFNNNKK